MTKQHEYKSAEHWDDVLDREFRKESDRAAVILTASLFDNALTQLLRTSLVASPTTSDDLLDGPNSPISTFSARINVSYRIGLISKRFCRDLHLIRVIRNQFAHNVAECTFEDSSVRSRVLELAKSSCLIERNLKMRAKNFEKGPRGDFLMTSSWMLWALNNNIENAEAIEEARHEWGYDPLSSEKALKQSKKTTKHSVKKIEKSPSIQKTDTTDK